MTGIQFKDDPDQAPRYSRQQPGWHVCVLSIFTFCIYNVYWFYKNLRLLHDHEAVPPQEQIDEKYNFCRQHPWFSTLLFLLPVANLIIAMQFFALVGAMLPERQSFWHKHNMLCAFALALAFGALVLLWRLPEPYNLFYVVSCLPLAIVQTGLNKHWRAIETGESLVRTGFNPIELVAIFFGAGLMGLCAVGPSIMAPGGH